MARARDAKTAIMAGALTLTGVFEFLEGVERGDDLLDCAYEAVHKTKLRGKAIKEASSRIAKRVRSKRRKSDA